MPRQSVALRALTFLLGGLLFTCGYLAFNASHMVLQLLASWPSLGLAQRYLDLQNALPLRLLALAPFCLPGGLLMAWALGPPRSSVPWPWPELAQPSSARRPVLLLVWVATLVLAAVTAWLLREPAHRVATYTWALSMLAYLAGVALLDRYSRAQAILPSLRDVLTAATLAAVVLVVVGHDLGHWRWSGIPDEFSFFAGAKGFYDGIIQTHTLSEEGVFGYHPVLSSYYQVLFMWLFGPTVVAWRLSSLVSLAAAVAATFLLLAQLRDRRTAVWGALLLATAQVAMSYSHLGYNNAQVYGAVMLPLALAAYAARGAALLPFAATGVFCGLGFYTYFTARLSPLLVLLLWWYCGALRRSPLRWRRLAVFAVGLLLTILPTLMQLPRTLAQMIRLTGATANTALPLGEAVGTLPAFLSLQRLGRIASHWLMSIFYPMTSESGHFMVAPVADGGTGFLYLLGLCLGVVALLRRRREFVAVAYFGAAFAVGAISPYPHPALTRIMFLAPFTAMLAAIGLDELVSRLGDRRWATGLGSAVVLAIGLANFSTLQHHVYGRFYGYGDGTTSELVRLVLQLPADTNLLYVQRDATYMAGTVPDVLTAYGRGHRLQYIRPPFSAEVLAKAEELMPPFFVAYDLAKPEHRETIEAIFARRFPQATWKDSATGRSWNLRYLRVPAATEALGP